MRRIVDTSSSHYLSDRETELINKTDDNKKRSSHAARLRKRSECQFYLRANANKIILITKKHTVTGRNAFVFITIEQNEVVKHKMLVKM